MAPIRIQLSRKNGFDLQVLSQATNGLPAVNVARPSKWGNPFNLRASIHCWTALAYGFKGDRLGRQAASVAMFREYLGGEMIGAEGCGLYADVDGERKSISVAPTVIAKRPAPTCDEIVGDLRGKNLACWCKPGEPCHADVLLEIAEASEARARRMEEALRPFADFAEALNEEVPDIISIGIFADGAMRFGPSGGANVGNLRKARAALSDSPAPAGREIAEAERDALQAQVEALTKALGHLLEFVDELGSTTDEQFRRLNPRLITGSARVNARSARSLLNQGETDRLAPTTSKGD